MIKNRESVSNFRTRNDAGHTNSNFYSTNNLYNLKNMSKICKSNNTEPNMNNDSSNNNNFNFNIEDNSKNLGNNSAYPNSIYPKSGFGPVIEIENGLKIDNLEVSRSNNLTNIKLQPVSKRQITQKEMDKLVQEYKSKLNGELLNTLQEEKYKEEEREVLYHNTVDIIEKKRLEKIISMERAQSSERILKMNE